MIVKSLVILALGLVLPASLFGQEALEEIVKKEQESSQDEAISIYGGKVGNADAVFFIEWAEAGEAVAGKYYLPVRGKNVLYVLKGTNPRAGVLELEEYLEQGEGNLVLNAHCNLKKRVDGTRIVWEGEKTYENGRTLPISFSRDK